MELMWGLKNLMKDIVPDEESELTIKDRMIMSQGMKSVLNHYGFEVEPEMVSSFSFSISEVECFCCHVKIFCAL